MKKTLFTVIILIIFKTVYCQDHYRFAIKSGYVKSKLTGSIVGTEEIYWDNYGANYYLENKSTSKFKWNGNTNEEKSHIVYYSNGLETILIDMINKTGTIYHKGMTDIDSCYKVVLSEYEHQKMVNQIIDFLKLPIVGERKILNRKCKIVQGYFTKYWIYKGVYMKSESMSPDGSMMYSKAKEFQENIEIPVERFEPPANIDIKDITQSTNAIADALFAIEYDLDKEKGRKYLEEKKVIIPTSYQFNSFEKAIKRFKPSGFTLKLINNEGGNHSAIFRGNNNSYLNITATSSSNINILKEKYVDFEILDYEFKPMLYGSIEEEGQLKNVLVIEYKMLHLHIIIEASKEIGLSKLLEYSKKLKFK
jgi:hypothetical protein